MDFGMGVTKKRDVSGNSFVGIIGVDEVNEKSKHSPIYFSN